MRYIRRKNAKVECEITQIKAKNARVKGVNTPNSNAFLKLDLYDKKQPTNKPKDKNLV